MGEDQRTEWKESWRDEYLRWVCAFANSEGGTLVIGRNDHGAVVGVKDASRLLEELPNKARDILGILVAVNLRQEEGKDYLEIEVDPYPYPVSYKGEYHVRSGSTKQELKGAALDKFLLRKQGKHWDGVPCPRSRWATWRPRRWPPSASRPCGASGSRLKSWPRRTGGCWRNYTCWRAATSSGPPSCCFTPTPNALSPGP